MSYALDSTNREHGLARLQSDILDFYNDMPAEVPIGEVVRLLAEEALQDTDGIGLLEFEQMLTTEEAREVLSDTLTRAIDKVFRGCCSASGRDLTDTDKHRLEWQIHRFLPDIRYGKTVTGFLETFLKQECPPAGYISSGVLWVFVKTKFKAVFLEALLEAAQNKACEIYTILLNDQKGHPYLLEGHVDALVERALVDGENTEVALQGVARNLLRSKVPYHQLEGLLKAALQVKNRGDLVSKISKIVLQASEEGKNELNRKFAQDVVDLYAYVPRDTSIIDVAKNIAQDAFSNGYMGPDEIEAIFSSEKAQNVLAKKIDEVITHCFRQYSVANGTMELSASEDACIRAAILKSLPYIKQGATVFAFTQALIKEECLPKKMPLAAVKKLLLEQGLPLFIDALLTAARNAARKVYHEYLFSKSQPDVCRRHIARLVQAVLSDPEGTDVALRKAAKDLLLVPKITPNEAAAMLSQGFLEAGLGDIAVQIVEVVEETALRIHEDDMRIAAGTTISSDPPTTGLSIEASL